MIRAGLVGYGYWGKLWGKKLQDHRDFSLDAICSRTAMTTSPEIKCATYTDLEKMLKNTTLDIVFIMSPVAEHMPQALRALKHQISTFVTKPIATTLADVERLHKEAQSAKTKVYVDHTFLYNPGYLFYKKLLKGKTIESISSQRFQWGRFQKQSNVFLELIYHDVYLTLDLLNYEGLDVECRATSHLPSGYIDTGSLLLRGNGVEVDLNACQTSPQVSRRLDVRTADEFFSWDFANTIVQRNLSPGAAENEAVSRSLSVPSFPFDAIDQTLSQIALDLDGSDSQTYGLLDAMKVHKILDKAFIPPS